MTLLEQVDEDAPAPTSDNRHHFGIIYVALIGGLMLVGLLGYLFKDRVEAVTTSPPPTG